MPEEDVKKKEKDTLSKIQALPKAVQDFILSANATEANIKIIKDFKLTPEQEDLFFDITNRVIFKELKLEDFSAIVEKEFGFDKEKSKKITLEILGNVFLPMDSYLGDVSEVIKRLGGNPNKFAVEHIVLEKISIDELTEKVLKESGISIEDSGHKRRLKNIIENRFNEVRDDADSIDTMMRGSRVGGLGLSEELSKKIVQVVKAKMGAFQIADDAGTSHGAFTSSKSKPVVNTLPKVPDNLPIKNLPPSVDEGSVSGVDTKKITFITPTEGSRIEKKASARKSDIIYGAEEEREIEHIRKEFKKKNTDEAVDFNKEVEKSIQNILEKGKFSFTDENLKQKFLNVISARLRDVRDKNETLDILSRDRGIGGLGLSEVRTRKILILMEEEVNLLGQIRKKSELKKLEGWREKRKKEQTTKKETETQKEEKNLEEKWTKLTGKPAEQAQKDVVATFMSPQDGNLKVSATPSPHIPSAPLRHSEELAGDEESHQETKRGVRTFTPLRSVLDDKKKPKVEDIKFTPRLIGPIEELRRITLNDFRQLAKNPKNATEKIKDKIELLEDESYTKKVEGMKAWKESEPSRIYFEILNKSTSEMMSVSDVLNERQEKKLSNLTKEEFDALMQFNKELRV